jgi:flagellar biosynthesis/type III secretory pathway ATPase
MYLDRLTQRKSSKKAVILEAIAIKALIEALRNTDGSFKGLIKAYQDAKKSYTQVQEGLKSMGGDKVLNQAVSVVQNLIPWLQQVYQQIQSQQAPGATPHKTQQQIPQQTQQTSAPKPPNTTTPFE